MFEENKNINIGQPIASISSDSLRMDDVNVGQKFLGHQEVVDNTSYFTGSEGQINVINTNIPVENVPVNVPSEVANIQQQQPVMFAQPQVMASQKKPFNLLTTILIIFWMFIGAYYFLGGSLNLNFLKGDLMNTDINKQELPNLSDQDMRQMGDNVDVSIVDSDSSKVSNDAVDNIFLTQEIKSPKEDYPAKVDAYTYADVDSDGDGLSDVTEGVLGTDKDKQDSDGDGLSDYQEVGIYGTNPLLVDTDKDGITDTDEILTGKNPNQYN